MGILAAEYGAAYGTMKMGFELTEVDSLPKIPPGDVRYSTSIVASEMRAVRKSKQVPEAIFLMTLKYPAY